MLGIVTPRRNLWLLLTLLVATVVLVAAAVVVLVPRYARQLVVWQLQSATGRPVTVAAFDLSLMSGEFSLRGVRVGDHDGGLLAEFDRLEGRFHRHSLLRLHLWVERLTLTNGHIRIVRVGPNRYNISDLLQRPASRRLFDVSIDRFTIDGGWVALEDRVLTPARTWRSEGIHLDARDVGTLAPRGTAFGFTTIAGALVTVRVEDLQLAPVHLRASVNLRDLDLRLPALYLPTDTPLELDGGTVDAGVSVTVDAKDGTTLDADAIVHQLALRARGVNGAAVTAPELTLLVRELRKAPDAMALRYASVGGDVTVLDPTSSPPRRLTFSDLTLTASGLDQLRSNVVQVAAHANAPGGGEVDVGGTVGLTPRRADVRVRAHAIELAILARYLPMRGQLAGLATADLRVVASHQGLLALTVTGDTQLDRPSLGDGSRALAAAARVAATGLRYTWPARVEVARLAVARPTMTIERDTAGAIGLATLLGAPPEPPAAPARTNTPAIDVRIAQLTVESGRLALADAASGSTLDVTGLALTGRNVTWPGQGSAEVDLSAGVAGAEVSARGTVDAAKRSTEITVGVHGGDLAVLQPWLPTTARVRGALGRADLTVKARYDGTLALSVTGDASLERLALAEGSRTPVTVARVAAQGLVYTWPATVRTAQLTLTRPAVELERDAAGALNLARLARRASASPTDGAPAPGPPGALDVAIAQLRVDRGRASVVDATTGGVASAANIAFVGRDVAWPVRGVSNVHVSADVAGGRLTATGNVDAARRRAELTVRLRSAELAALQSWLPIVGRVRGTADADLAATVELDPFTLAIRGTASAADLALLADTRPLLTVARVDASGIDAQWPASLAIDRLRVNGPWAQVDRNPDGELSLRALFARRADRPAPPTTAPVAAGLVPGLDLSVRDALFDNGSLNIVDDAVEPAARFELHGARLELHNLTWPARGPAVVALTMPTPRSGTLKASGTLSIEPTRLQLQAEFDQVDLGPGRPYLPIDAQLNGRVSGRTKVDGTFGDTISLVVDGDIAVDRFALGDTERRLATAQRAELTGLRYRYPTSLRIREVVLRKPWALVERTREGSLELASLLARRWRQQLPAPAAAAGAGPASPPQVRVAVNKLTLQDGFLRFVDRTTGPNFAEELSGISLAAEGLGTSARRHGTVDLRGTLASGNTLTVRGQVGALAGPPFLDLIVDVKDYPVLRLNPYLDRLSSWIARQGAVTASLHYKLAGDDLDATNEVTLVGLEMEPGGKGREVEQHVGLPLGLLVSLLKNRQGEIHLSIPVSGRLSSPSFDYHEAMWTAIRNLAIRLVSLPFSWIGGMYYTADARIDSIQVYPVPFQTASAVPTTAGGEQLQRLATFLRESPAIRLRLRPVTTVADVSTLRRQALDARLAAAGSDPTARHQAAVALYAELFPRRQPPPSSEALLDELTRETPTPPRALRALSTDRAATVRDALVRAGIAADRVEPAEARAAVESEGEGRVEFEIVR